jgi:hypothetical protein
MTDPGLFELEITESEQVPSSGVAFHGTRREIARTIVAEGFDPTRSDRSEKHDERFLTGVARDAGISLPVDRLASSFFYTTLADADHFIAPRLGECLLVVDAERLDNPMSIGDTDAYDSVISYTPYRSPERARDGPYTDEERRVARQYIDSLLSVETVSDIRAAQARIERPELIIEGYVPPEAIVGVIREPLDDK